MHFHLEKIRRAIVDAINDRSMSKADLIDLFTLLHVSVSNVLTHLFSLPNDDIHKDDRNDTASKFSNN